MTSPVFEPKAPRRKRRSALKRQRLLILVLLIVVGLLGGTFGVVYYYTSRNLVTLNGEPLTDADGTRYYAKQIDGVWTVVNEDGEPCRTTDDSNEYSTVYRTADGALIEIDHTTGAATVIAIVDTEGDEDREYNSATNSFDILMYPLLEREQIGSIRVVNEEGEFAFLQLRVCTDKDCLHSFTYNEAAENKLACPKCGAATTRTGFQLEGFPAHEYDENLFSTLVISTGYTSTYMKLDREKVQQYGYGEYGLPANAADAKNYFVITDTDGKSQKVILGNAVVSGTGYYAMREGHPDVYILKEMEETDYSYTLSKALLSPVEAYVTPTVMDTMGSTDYFDVSDFELNAVANLTEEMLKDPDLDIDSLITNIVKFSYLPIELRKVSFGSTTPYDGSVKYEGFSVSDYMIDDCLQNLMDLAPLRTVKLFSEEENKDQKGLFYFAREYGVAFCMEYTHNLERDAKKNYKPTKWVDQLIWISPLSEDGTYFLYNEAYQMIVEVERTYLEFLQWDTFTWVEGDVFDGGITFMEKLEIIIPGAEHLVFELDNSESLIGWEEEGASSIPVNKLKVWANGKALSPEQLKQFKLFYQTLIYSSLSGSASCSEEQQQAFRDAAKNVAGGYATADGQQAQIVLNITYNTKVRGDGEQVFRSYAFYKYGGGRQCFMAFNGNGGFYMLQSRVSKIISDVGKIMDPTTPIEPQSKS